MIKLPLFALVLSLVAGAAHADLLYTSSFCGGAYAPCTITRGTYTRPSLAPLDDQAFIDFFVSRGYGPYFAQHEAQGYPPPTFQFFLAGYNDEYEFGFVNDTSGYQMHTVYIDGADGLICCTIDEPFRFTGINANNLMIGQDGGGYPFVNSLGFQGYNGPSGYRVVSGDTFGNPSAGYRDQFLAIDDENNILAQQYLTGQYYELRVVDPVPTPATLPLLAAGLLFLAAYRRRPADHQPR